jgi:hypothetical protein
MSDFPNDPGALNVCGFGYDHDFRLIDERDGCRSYECRECGAEILEEDG